MGLFTDRCTNPACAHRVRKGSQFCPKCGTPSPKGLSQCGRCGAEVRLSSRFCWKCGAETAAVAKPLVLDDRWSRQPGDFAVRIDSDNIKGFFIKPLVMEYGTRALLFQAGRCKGEVTEGRYDMGGFLARLKNFLIDQQASIIVMDAGDMTLDLENGDLWSADHLAVGTSVRLAVRINDPDALFLNLFKSRNRITLDDMEMQLSGEIRMVLGALAGQHPARELFANLGLRGQIEAQLRGELQGTLGRLGLELVQLRFMEFSGAAFEELRRKQGELTVAEAEGDITAQRARLNQRLREALTQEKMDEFKTGKNLEEFIRQTEHELGLKGEIRQDEMLRLTQRFEFERNRESLLRRIEIEGITNDERREQAWKELLSEERQRDERHQRELERQLGTTTNELERKRLQVEMEKIENQEDMRQAEDGLRLLKQTKDIQADAAAREQEVEGRRLAERSKATSEALLTIVEGPAAERIAQLETLRRQQSLTPEQILAMAAQASPAAAHALAQKYQIEGQINATALKNLEQQLAGQRQMSESHADRMERLMHAALGQMGDVAATRARPGDTRQTVVAQGGMSPPMVINAPGGGRGACKFCHAALEGDGQFCPQCGKLQ